MSQYAATTTATATRQSPPNEVDWDGFHSSSYFRNNYAVLRQDDRRFLSLIRDHFGGIAKESGAGRVLRGVDAGAGTNIYPALAMLPLCRVVDLLEFSQQNCDWLNGQIAGASSHWEPHWRVLAEHEAYASLGRKAKRHLRDFTVRKGSLFDLAERQYEVGTMFFVAESITDDRAVFERAVRTFVGSLVPGAPFAAAFMRNSAGYQVNGQDFPALRVDTPDIQALLGDAKDLRVETVDAYGQSLDRAGEGERDRPLRSGYEGMILAYGRV